MIQNCLSVSRVLRSGHSLELPQLPGRVWQLLLLEHACNAEEIEEVVTLVVTNQESPPPG